MLSAHGGNQIVRVRVITEGFADMGETVRVARTENKAAAELKRVLAQTMLANPDRFRPLPGTCIVRPKKMEQVGIFQGDRAIGFTLIVYEEGESNTGLIAEVAGVAGIAQTHGRQFGATLFELLFVLAQPRDVLAAEDSTIVTEKDDHGRGIGPERPEAYRLAINVGQRNVCELAAVLSSHGQLFSRAQGIPVNTEPRFILSARLC